jgi:hypothetical protein
MRWIKKLTVAVIFLFTLVGATKQSFAGNSFLRAAQRLVIYVDSMRTKKEREDTGSSSTSVSPLSPVPPIKIQSSACPKTVAKISDPEMEAKIAAEKRRKEKSLVNSSFR